MSDLISQPETWRFSGSYAPGVLEQYSTAELDQIGKLQDAGVTVSSAEANFRYEVIRLKLMLDSEDRADGVKLYNSSSTSRFWDGARAGHFGDRLLLMTEKGDRTTVHRWIKANNAAEILLGSCVTNATQELPLKVAKELGINSSTLEIYATFDNELREAADFYYEATGQLKADMLKRIRTVFTEFVERKDEFLQGIANKTIKYPSHVDDLIEEWNAQRRELEAVRRAEEHAAKLAAAEHKEEQLENEAAPNADTPKPAKVEDVTRRKARTSAWFKTDSGLIKTKEVVGDLAAPLADAVNGLVDLKKELIAQVEHMGEMHDYAEFWAGYDRHAMSASAAQRIWGKAGRLGRMKKLRGLLIEIQQRLDVYIENSSPPSNIEYPDE